MHDRPSYVTQSNLLHEKKRISYRHKNVAARHIDHNAPIATKTWRPGILAITRLPQICVATIQLLLLDPYITSKCMIDQVT